MPAPILASKLFIPRPRPKVVPRPRLTARLNAGLHGKLTLISAPAGFGKTTLAAGWLSASQRPAAWLAPDTRDNERTRFLIYLVAALQTLAGRGGIGPEFGKEALDLLQSAQPPDMETILTRLLNEIAVVEEDFVLVLDDYHVIDSRAVDEAVAFLIAHMPPQMHLLITTREDPDLPLARLRVRGELHELRAADLRFTAEEAAEFLNQVMDLALTAEEVDALERRTEGWIAGLQMAALSLRGLENTAEFIHAFTGSHTFVMEYLVEEVVRRQPPAVRDFLLQTALLERLSGPLCAAVTGQADSQKTLEALQRGDLLITPLDDNREWFRYHGLFADMLQAHLLAEQPDLVPALHGRASRWYEAHGTTDAAVRHALAARDFERAADLVERAWPQMYGSFQNAAWLAWAEALPPATIRARPVLSVDTAWTLLNRGELEAADGHMRSAERWLESPAAPREGMVVADTTQMQTLPASLAAARAYHAQALGDVAATVRFGRRALDLYAPDERLQRGIVSSILGLAYLESGQLDDAYDALAEGMADMQAAGNMAFALRGAYILADIRLAQGRLREAIAVYERLLGQAAQHGESVLRGTADLQIRLGELFYEQNETAAAQAQFVLGEELGQQATSPIWRYRFALAQARMKKAQGDLDGALALLDKAARYHVRTPVPELFPTDAQKARVWIAQGRLAEAREWARQRGLSPDDKLSYAREYEHITLARLLAARQRSGLADPDENGAQRLLQRLLHAAQEGGRMGSALEILIQQALLYAAVEDFSASGVALARALQTAEAGGYVRIFVDEGEPMAQLLKRVSAQGGSRDYAHRVLAVFAAAGSIPPAQQPLIEPLSERELQVLALMAQGLSNREIGERLFLALSTVKGHNGRIFGKLAVQNRTEAAARARELGLI